MSTRQDWIDTTRHYLTDRLPGLDLPIESFTMQEHRAAIAWALRGGRRPACTRRARTRTRPAPPEGRRRGTLDPDLAALLKGAPPPPGKVIT